MCSHCEIEHLKPEINPLGGLENLGSRPKHIFLGVQASIPWSVEDGRACNWRVYEICSLFLHTSLFWFNYEMQIYAMMC